MKLTEILSEGDVVQNKFVTKQAQKGKDKYRYNQDIADDIPTNRGEPYDHFEVREAGPTAAHIIGVTLDGDRVRLSTAHKKLAYALVDAYNRGGFTDEDIQKVPMGEGKVWDKPMPEERKKGKLTAEQKARARARAKAAGRPYPNMVDNMAVSKGK